MCCEQLVCASCAHPVAEARCTVCRDARSSLHGSQQLSAAWVAVALTLLLALAAVAYAHLGA
jgi:hypothetical protein